MGRTFVQAKNNSIIMKKYLNLLILAGAALPFAAVAQNETDALRYGQLSSGATARSLGLGGTGGSVGGDFSSLSINPAGIGVYRNSEVMITPTFRFNKMTGTYLGSEAQDDKTKMGLNNFGVVFTTAARGERYNKSDWKAFSFGVGYNRLADFNARGTYSGLNGESSITEGFRALAINGGTNDNGQNPPYGFLAFQTYVLTDNLNSIPYENIIKNGGKLQQTKNWQSSGGVNEFTLSVGGNYREKLLLGATVGITSYKFDRSTTYSEDDATGNPDNDFKYVDLNEQLSTTGIGVNLKLGAIYVVNDVLRLGAAVHTPTWSAYSDVADYSMSSNTENYKTSGGPESFARPQNTYQFDYSLRTPWRGLLSAAVFMGKYGFITADYEYVAYNSMRYNFRENSFADYERDVNNAIKDTYKGGHIFRVGVEGKASNFMGRLGFAYHTNPYQVSDKFKGDRMDLSAGVGVRFGAFFMDLAYVHMIQKSSEFGYPVVVSGVPIGIADVKYGNNLVALTLGFKF